MKRHESLEDSHSETWPSENFEPRRLVPAVRQRKTGWRKPDQVFCFIKQILCKYVTECNSYCSKSRQLTQKSDTFRVLYETMFHINVQVPKPSINHQSIINSSVRLRIHISQNPNLLWVTRVSVGAMKYLIDIPVQRVPQN